MSLQDKPFYFITDRSTHFQYFVDNTHNQPKSHIFYPDQYETMKNGEILKHKLGLSKKLLWWAIMNKDKMVQRDWSACFSKVFDLSAALLLTMLLARGGRMMLFKNNLGSLQYFMDMLKLDVKFTKALIVYSASGSCYYKYFNQSVNQLFLVDLAFEYHPNFLNEKIHMSSLEPVCSKLYLERFPWLKQQ